MTDTTSPVVTQLAALTVEARRIADALTAPLPGEDDGGTCGAIGSLLTMGGVLPGNTGLCYRHDSHKGVHRDIKGREWANTPGAGSVDVAAAMTGVTPGGNAEDCPRCTDPNPDYPFLCPGHPATDNSSDPAACGDTAWHPAHRYMQWGQVHQCPGAEAQACSEDTTRHVGTSTIGEPATPGRATITIAVTAPNQDNANRWAGTIRDLVTAEHGHHMRLDITISDSQQYEQSSDDGLREQYAAAIRAQAETGNVRYEALADVVLAVRDRRIEQLTAERDQSEDAAWRFLAQRQEMAAERYEWQRRGDRAEAERDSLGREADRLRKDWVQMRTRAEQAEATIARVREVGPDLEVAATAIGLAEPAREAMRAASRRIRTALDGTQTPAAEPETDTALAEWRSAAEGALKEVEQQTARADDAEVAIARAHALAECWKYTGDRKNGPRKELLTALNGPQPATAEPGPADAQPTISTTKETR
ncbi:MAG: hypothetical protein JWO98_147 [Frankiales bacterium]|nr:hypothetical protein [Frankiales bacterium]